MTPEYWDAKAILLQMRAPQTAEIVSLRNNFSPIRGPLTSTFACEQVGVEPTDDNKHQLVAALKRVKS